MDGTIDRICTALAVPSRWAEAEMAVGDAMGTQGHLGDSGEEFTPG